MIHWDDRRTVETGSHTGSICLEESVIWCGTNVVSTGVSGCGLAAAV